MPRILVISDTSPPEILLNESVTGTVLDDTHTATGVIERLACSLARGEAIEAIG